MSRPTTTKREGVSMKETHDTEGGQAIVIMVFAIIAMAALVGLAVDGGHLYTLRRQAQNAADAAALAGARHLGTRLSECAPSTVADNTEIMNIVLEYARLNDVDEFSPDGDVTAWYVNKDGVNVGAVRNDVPIPAGATGVAASTVTTETTTSMKLFWPAAHRRRWPGHRDGRADHAVPGATTSHCRARDRDQGPGARGNVRDQR